MNTALAILAHALRMLIFDLATTFRVLLPAMLVVVGCAVASATLAPDVITLLGAPPEEMVPPSGGDLLIFVGLGIGALLGYALMAVLWHRHVLLNGAEQRDALRPSPQLFFGYVGRAIVVALVQLIAAIPVALAMGVLGASFMTGGPSGPATTAIGLVGSMIFIWIALRYSVVLPAAALGQHLAIRDSWAKTRLVSLPLLGVAGMLTGLNMLVFMITDALIPERGVVAAAVQSVVFLAEGLVFISVLTTLYGFLIEKRSLGQ